MSNLGGITAFGNGFQGMKPLGGGKRLPKKSSGGKDHKMCCTKSRSCGGLVKKSVTAAPELPKAGNVVNKTILNPLKSGTKGGLAK